MRGRDRSRVSIEEAKHWEVYGLFVVRIRCIHKATQVAMLLLNF